MDLFLFSLETHVKDSQRCCVSLQTNCNVICGPEYAAETKRSMAQINEKELSFELVEALLKYIETLKVVGAVLIFLPGWNLIYSMQRYLETNPHFGMPRDHITVCHNWVSSILIGFVFESAPSLLTLTQLCDAVCRK